MARFSFTFQPAIQKSTSCAMIQVAMEMIELLCWSQRRVQPLTMPLSPHLRGVSPTMNAYNEMYCTDEGGLDEKVPRVNLYLHQ